MADALGTRVSTPPAERPAAAGREPACGCHPAYHELGVHAPDWRG